jgi:Na+-driven multidrug efflux pump
LVFPVVSYLLAFPPIAFMHTSSPIRATCPAHHTFLWLDHFSYTWRRVQAVWSSSLCSFLHPSVTSSFFGPNTPLMSENTHPYRTTDKIIVLYILIFVFLDKKIKMFWTECYQALSESNLLLISSWIRFWFVIVGPKYLNCYTFSKHLLPIFISWFCPAFWWHLLRTLKILFLWKITEMNASAQQ